ncbi:MAG: V-type ATP synthase subunit I [Cyclobacteriaceae bacterium]|nr:V-type ATP synthase subunit I [Cyclobacteriaceae bacterium HetDA_MAG_MS6]
MKATFKKMDLLFHHHDRDRITKMLQELGVIHLELNDDFRNERIEELELQKSRLTKVIAFVEEYVSDTDFSQEPSSQGLSVAQVIEGVVQCMHQRESDRQETETLSKIRQKLLPWGSFDAEKLSRLVQSGIQVSFYVADKKEFNKVDLSQLTYQVVHEGADRLYLVVVSANKPISLPFEEVDLPVTSARTIQSREKHVADREVERARTMLSYAPYLPLLSEEWTKVENLWLLNQADGSYEEYAEGSILHMAGWFPTHMEGRLQHFMREENLAYVFRDPRRGDSVPVLLKNPKYPKLFESITRIFQLPTYYEMDLTPFIAVFYPILFAYCLGDAGYGLILGTGALVGWFTFLRSSRNLAVLGIILGVITTLMGVVKSGSVFGLPITTPEANLFFQYLAQYVVIPDDRGVIFNAFNVALLIGVVQILTGIVVSIVNKVRYKSLQEGLPQLGKLLMVVALIWMFLADMQDVVALKPFVNVRRITLAVGVLLVVFFHDMGLPVFRRALSGFLPLFFILTGILGDVLSYVRLFALGVASSVLGLVVNQIGMQIMGDNWWGVLLGVVFLLIGHSLNFALAALGAFVHPLRLTFVEFYNNAQFEGGGIPYKPLHKIKVSHSK